MKAASQAVASPSQLVIRPHPVMMDGYRKIEAALEPGESLAAFVERHVPDLYTEEYEVAIGGVVIPREQWGNVKPKHGQLIEVRSAVGKSVVALVAMAALMYFTVGFGTATAGMWGAGAAASAWGQGVALGLQTFGSTSINRIMR